MVSVYSCGMSSDMDDILKRVAAGELSPEEAIRHLDAGRPQTPLWTEQPPGPRTEDRPRPAGGADDVTSVRISASYRNLDVIADPAVATAYAEGEHVIEQDGSTLVVDGRGAGLFGGTEDPRSWRFAFNAAVPRGKMISRGWWDHNLTVRVNPLLPLQIDAVGSKLRVRGGEAGGDLRLVASSVGLEALRGPIRLEANSSSVKGGLAPVGECRILAEQSSVKVALLPGSDVRIKVRNRMSKVVLPERVGRSRTVKQEWAECVVGEGRGELTLDAMMSSIVLVSEIGYGAWS